jgi:hypothetical protein
MSSLREPGLLRPGRGCNHFPVGQAYRTGGRRSPRTGRPTVRLPISEIGLRGRGPESVRSLRHESCLSRTPSNSKSERAARPDSPGRPVSGAYDRSERCYKIENGSGHPGRIDVTLPGSTAAPVVNPALYIKNWNGEGARVLVNGREADGAEIAASARLEGTDLVVFLPMKSASRVEIRILPR